MNYCNYFPIIVLPYVMHPDRVVFFSPDDECIIDGEWAEVIKTVLPYCNGRFSVADIATALDTDTNVVEEIINNLDQIGVVTDSREQYKHFHRVSNFPTNFSRNLTQEEIREYSSLPRAPIANGKSYSTEKSYIPSILLGRHSCRKYSGERMSLSQAITICASGYGIQENGKFMVPSAGGLYPLKLYMVVQDDQRDFPRGLYEFDPDTSSLVLYEECLDFEDLKYCFNREEMFGSKVQLVIAADFDKQGYKYANRAYRFALIEAGHVAQNICIAAASLGLATCELGGTLDEALKRALEMPDGYWPTLAITLGYEDYFDTAQEPDYLGFIEQNVGEDKPVKSVNVWSSGGSFYTAIATYYDNETECISGATARSDVYAEYKAVIEAYERKEAFNGPGHERVTNSCGIAAHFDPIRAQNSALAELIERDAIMKCWFYRDGHQEITTLDTHVAKRQAFYASIGCKMTVLLLESDYAPVVLVAIRGDKNPYFACGAASSIKTSSISDRDELFRLQNKALMEAESAFLYYKECPEEDVIEDISKTFLPEDHGKLYRTNVCYAQKLDWLFNTTPVQGDVVWHHSRESIINTAEVRFRELGVLENGLHVIEATSSKMAKMDFGIINCPDDCLDPKRIIQESLTIPHFFA